MTQRIAILLWVPSVLLISNCGGSQRGVVGPNNELQAEQSETIFFCGNPGVGKSALCNSIFQEARFKSGISKGVRVTKEKQEYTYENKNYIDTPGLADVTAREEAAREIESGLKKNNNYKIVFVALLDSGRVRASDLVTINTVCSAIKTPFEYGLIFNKVSRQVSREIGNVNNLNEYLAQLHKQPVSTIIISKAPDIDDENDKFLSRESENRQKLIQFIHGLRANKIARDKVQPLDIKDYEIRFRKMEAKLAEKLRELDELQGALSKEAQNIGRYHTNSGIVNFIVQTRKYQGYEHVQDFKFHHQDLNEHNRGYYVYVGWRMGNVNGNTPLVTSVDFKAFDEQQTSPANGWKWCPEDVNSGAFGRYIYLHFKTMDARGEEGKTPIQALNFSSPMYTSIPPDKGDDWKLISQNLCEGCSSIWRFHSSPYTWAYYTRKPQEE